MGSVKEMNPYKKDNRVKFNNKDHFLYGQKGVVLEAEEISTYVQLDSGNEIITSYKNLVKLKKKIK